MMPSTKPRISIYLSEEIYERIRGYSEKPGWTTSKLVETALTSWFSHEQGDKRDAALIKRLDKLHRQTEVSQSNQIVTSEAVSLLAKYVMMLLPPIPDADVKAAKALGSYRHENFIKVLKSTLSDGERVLFRAMEDVKVESSGFFSREDILKLKNPSGET